MTKPTSVIIDEVEWTLMLRSRRNLFFIYAPHLNCGNLFYQHPNRRDWRSSGLHLFGFVSKTLKCITACRGHQIPPLPAQLRPFTSHTVYETASSAGLLPVLTCVICNKAKKKPLAVCQADPPPNPPPSTPNADALLIATKYRLRDDLWMSCAAALPARLEQGAPHYLWKQTAK